jgi:hypothetical protein
MLYIIQILIQKYFTNIDENVHEKELDILEEVTGVTLMTTSQNINKQKRAMEMRVVYKRTSFNFLRHVIIEEKRKSRLTAVKDANVSTFTFNFPSLFTFLHIII